MQERAAKRKPFVEHMRKLNEEEYPATGGVKRAYFHKMDEFLARKKLGPVRRHAVLRMADRVLVGMMKMEVQERGFKLLNQYSEGSQMFFRGELVADFIGVSAADMMGEIGQTAAMARMEDFAWA